jgi:osmoprotectant transport system substrate-binding protein
VLSPKKRFVVFTIVAAVSLLLLSGCGGNKESTEGAVLKIGSQGYAEVEILGELAKALIEENTPHKVEHITSLGSAIAGHEATVRGDLDMNTSFTGTLFLGLLQQELTDEWRDSDKVFQYVHEKMLEKYGLYAVPPYGYNNTYAVAVPRAWAEQHNVTKQSDLKPFAKDMVLAVDQSWKNYPGQGYKEYTELYGFEFKATPEMDFGIMYMAIDKGEVDAINCYSTDGQLIAQDLLVLEDDLGFNPPYNGILVVRNETLENYPELREVLSVLEGLIDTEQMQMLNKGVSVDEKNPSEVAREFLKQQGLIK